MLSDITYQNSFFSKNKAINERADHKLITQGNLMFVHELLLKTIKRLNNSLIFLKVPARDYDFNYDRDYTYWNF